MKNDEDPSFSEELEYLGEWDRAFWLSRAYIEGSQCLCERMLEGDFSSQYSSSRVILHLARQGIELFLKAAIGAHSASEARGATHNLRSLYGEYRTLYAGDEYAISFPPEFHVSMNFELFDDDHQRFHATLDQGHRYPSDRKGASFTTRETFDPVATQNQLGKLDRELKIIEWIHIRPALKQLISQNRSEQEG